MSHLRPILRCLQRAAVNTVNHDGIEHAGYLAFLGLLALFPFLVFVVAVIGVIGPETAAAQYVTSIFHRLPAQVYNALEPRIMEITSGPPQGLLTLAIVGAIWTSSGAVEGLRTVLNRAYHVHTPPTYLFRRTLSILQLLLFAFIVIIGLVLLVAVPVIFHRAEEWLGIALIDAEALWWSQLIYTASFALIYLVVCWAYYALPNIRQHFVSIAPGALLVVVLWFAAVQLFTLYLSHFHQVNLIYGSLGGVIVALVFFYVCNVIFIFGAEFNYLFSQLFGMKIEEREQVEEAETKPSPERA
jgi:membrane protein